MKDIANMHSLQLEMPNLQQVEKFIKVYVAETKLLYDELSLFEPKWVDDQNTVLREKQIQRDKFYKFIIGLIHKFDGAKIFFASSIKGPPMNDVIAKLQMEYKLACFTRDKGDNVIAIFKPGASLNTYKPPNFNRYNLCHLSA